MKLIIAGVVLAVVMGLAVTYRDNLLTNEGLTYVKSTVEVTKEVTPDWAKDEDAVQAAKDVIRKKELQAELETLDMEIKAKQEQRKKVTEELTAY